MTSTLFQKFYSNSYPLLSHPSSAKLSTFLFLQAPSHPTNIFYCHTTSKNPSLDKDDLTTYRPISIFLHLQNNRTNSQSQSLILKISLKSLSAWSAYFKNHPTLTMLLSLYDDLSNAIAHQQVSSPYLLDLSAAFDTLDHYTTHSAVYLVRYLLHLSHLVPLLSFVSSSVSIGGTPSNITISLRCPTGSVLGPILFNLYTTSISTLIANTSLSHHLYDDDTQLFTSFVPTDFPFVINYLGSSVSNISSLMTANLLTLNISNTELTLIGLLQ